METTYKLGSLFDGSGGFPLAGSLCGITPVWAAEIEPYPIAVTTSRFPRMKHLGDISKINGAEVEPVDIITFGSPCQDLSVAGKRAGLKHTENGDDETTRSGLFMEAVRIIKEMRKATGGEFPRFALWENVPSAFSSQKGEDFRVVLEELIRIVEPGAAMPPVPKAGWAYADHYRGDGWSLAYRVFDAQYWGVPQRRRRIHLIVDFRGERAREVLFEREGVRGYFAEGRTPWQGLAGDAQDCAGADDRAGESGGGAGGRGLDAVAYTLKIRSGVAVDSAGKAAGKGPLVQVDKAATLSTTQDQYLFAPTAYSFDSLASNSMKSSNPHSGCRQVEVAKTLDTTDPNPSKNQGGIAVLQPVPDLLLDDQGGQQISVRTDEKSPTLRAEAHGNVPAVVCKEQYLFENHSQDTRYRGPLDVSPMLPAQLGTGGNNTPFVTEVSPVYCLQGNGIDRADTAGCNGKGVKEDVCYTLNTIARPAVAYLASGKETVGTLMANAGTKLWLGNQEALSGDYHIIEGTAVRYIVRRLTPTECARLQGFADRWGDIEEKTELSDEEYAFWTEVRVTHAAINGKEPKTYSKEQMLNWYNKLHTDSSEYKMWGNGIALPTALYCMQGISEVLHRD